MFNNKRLGYLLTFNLRINNGQGKSNTEKR